MIYNVTGFFTLPLADTIFISHLHLIHLQNPNNITDTFSSQCNYKLSKLLRLTFTHAHSSLSITSPMQRVLLG